MRLFWKAIWSAEATQRAVVAFAIVSVQLANNSERAILNDNDSLPKYVQEWRSKKKALWKETTAIPAQICSVWRRLAFHIDSGGLSTVPPTLLRPLIGRIERARRQNCGDGRSSRGTLKYGAKAVWVKRGQIRSSKRVTRKVLTVGNTWRKALK